jgi:hypothetical protein
MAKNEKYYMRNGLIGVGGAMAPVMVKPQDRIEDGKVVGVTMGGPIAYCDTSKQAQGIAARLNWADRTEELLASIRQYMDERADAEYVDGRGTPHGNTEMGFLVEIDELLKKAG